MSLLRYIYKNKSHIVSIDWCARLLQNLQDFYSMMINMLIHDYRYNWGDSPLVIHMEDVESRTNRRPNTTLESTEKRYTMVHYTNGNDRTNNKYSGVQYFQPQMMNMSDDSDDEDSDKDPLYPMCQSRSPINYNNADDLSLPSTSKR